jgi:hypothetical protein
MTATTAMTTWNRVSAWDKAARGWLSTGEPVAQTLGSSLPQA